MKKFEYCSSFFSVIDFEELDLLGSQGWELCLSFPVSRGHQLVFKREIIGSCGVVLD